MRCPRCQYVRRAADSTQAAECPSCRVPYADGADLPLRISAGEHVRQMLREAATDPSLYVLVATNAIVLAIALRLGMSLRSLMLVYWIQSMVIGACAAIRILSLGRFSTAGFTVNGARPDESAQTKHRTAGFFVMHYGIFHVVYLAFLLVWPGEARFGTPMAYLLCGLAFMVNHAFSLRRNLAKDAAGQPNIGTLMFLPYARILPMHLMLCTGLAFGPYTANIVVFAILKTAADALMHVVEHHVLATGSGPASRPG